MGLSVAQKLAAINSALTRLTPLVSSAGTATLASAQGIVTAAVAAGSISDANVSALVGYLQALQGPASDLGDVYLGEALQCTLSLSYSPPGLGSADVAAALGFPYVRPSGDTTGATDRANINAALLLSNGCQLGVGIYYVDQKIKLNATGMALYGQGKGLTFIRSASGNTDVIELGSAGVPDTNTYTFKNSVRDLTVTGPQAGTGNGIVLNYVGEFELRGVTVEKQGAAGLKNINSYDGHYWEFTSSDNYGLGLDLSGSAFNEHTFYGSNIIRNRGIAVALASSVWRTVRFYGGNIEANAQSGGQWGAVPAADAFTVSTSGIGLEVQMYFEANATSSNSVWDMHILTGAGVSQGVFRCYQNPTSHPANVRIESGASWAGVIDYAQVDDQSNAPLWSTTGPTSTSVRSKQGTYQFPLQYQKLAPGYSYGNTYFPGANLPVHIFDADGNATPLSARISGIEVFAFDGKSTQGTQVGARGTMTCKGNGTALPALITNYSAGQFAAKIYNEYRGGIFIGDGGTNNVLQVVTSAGATVASISNTGNITLKPDASATPANNGEMTFQLTNNTTLVVKVKGSDGTVRSTTLTLA